MESVSSFAFIEIATTNLFISPNSEVSFAGYQNSMISEFIVPDNHFLYIEEDGIIYNKDKTILYAYPPEKSNESFEIPSKVQEINSAAFGTCKYLKHIKLPEGLSKIESYCFGGANIIEILIPETVTNIDNYAFQKCYNLKTVQLQCSLKAIPAYLFYLCKSLQTIIIIGDATIKEKAFEGCNSLCEIYSTENVKNQILQQISSSFHCYTKHCKCLFDHQNHLINVLFIINLK